MFFIFRYLHLMRGGSLVFLYSVSKPDHSIEMSRFISRV